MIRTNLIIDFDLEFDLALNSTSIKMTFYCISSNHSILTCHDHASYCCIALIMFLLCLSVLVPSQQTCTNDVIDDTDEELYYLQKCQASKTSLFIPIKSHSLAPALFYCIRTTTTFCYLLRQLNPFILCMTCHCHSKQMKPTSMSRSCLSPDVPTHSFLFLMPAIAQS